MCGIAGHWSRKGSADSEPVLTMLRALAHRGPDGGGLLAEEGCVLGHRRLAIHDLSDRGLQPFQDDADDLVVVANGTIHNAPELHRSSNFGGARHRNAADHRRKYIAASASAKPRVEE